MTGPVTLSVQCEKKNFTSANPRPRSEGYGKEIKGEERSSNGPLMMKVVTRHPIPVEGKEGQRYVRVRSFILPSEVIGGGGGGGGEQLHYEYDLVSARG